MDTLVAECLLRGVGVLSFNICGSCEALECVRYGSFRYPASHIHGQERQEVTLAIQNFFWLAVWMLCSNQNDEMSPVLDNDLQEDSSSSRSLSEASDHLC